ncbi:hypothetical protein SPRG_06095 [Saprolegnia parasitica CBS 223.65]|uniref:Uncharacterized protein n=1 Tax=Saprolegnia parasitica (strain CBS 223.65) TaxID=695850 RepID=A0A067CIM8_SAPPC|nr:hypothetical protein SPRG_06095 [Saprolegnia parasitica CBS 223.65]KDO29040.1 hypothetical protein SPRG_06095 [Saprolegnia parasitica CBS 223.65]|eukprot:XP_012200210.1 hypothetical protein SPRG_06095 [Saprolegnia parasitica CBS 223.65]
MSEPVDATAKAAPPQPERASSLKTRPAYIRTTERAAAGYLDPRSATVKKPSPTNDALLRESLQVQAEPSTCVTSATTQLKVLCRKFAVLSEKVKQEAKLREDAEREIKRLNTIIDGNTNMVVSSTRSDTQMYIRSLQEELDRVKEELAITKDELAQAQMDFKPRTAYAYQSDTSHVVDHHTKWDREQMQKIQDTLSCTINELQEELTAKDHQVDAFRETSRRDKAKIKDLEHMLEAVEEQAHVAKETTAKAAQELRDAAALQSSDRHKLHLAQETVKEERNIKEALQHQIATLHQVNDALQRRCDTLVRRLKLNSTFATEAQTLKQQVLDAERDHEVLVKTIRELKNQHFDHVSDLKGTLHETQATNQELSKRIRELETEMQALRSQNAIISDYSVHRGATHPLPYSSSRTMPQAMSAPLAAETHSRYRPSPFAPALEPRAPSLLTDDGYRQPPMPQQPQQQQRGPEAIESRGPENEQPRSSAPTKGRPGAETDHSILRALKHRNKQLQERLQQEADATYQLEEEINMITSGYHSLLHNES